tara:strand:- start:19798 stop:19971 length:174 start_codon:yes stop_codon:yes gene_type:complete
MITNYKIVRASSKQELEQEVLLAIKQRWVLASGATLTLVVSPNGTIQEVWIQTLVMN